MSSFKPVKVLKGVFKGRSGGISFRKVLVVIQFSISIILIVATTVVFQQLHYMQQKSLGFNKDQMVDMSFDRTLNSRYDSFRNELLKNPAIKEISRSTRIPSGRLLDDQDASVEESTGMQPTKVDIKCVGADYGFIPAYDIKMVAGRNFSPKYGTDTSNFILNEVAVKQLGWKNAQKAIGKKMVYGNQSGQIIGVMHDFYFESLHQKIIPLVLYLQGSKNSNYAHMSVKIAGNVPSAMNTIESSWHNYMPKTPFDYVFLDAKFQQLYDNEQQQGNLFTVFSLIAIFIACLGLFGLSAFTISQRVKEIGIRKILGANVTGIVMELSKDFIKLVIIAIVIASPFAWWAMKSWLQGFAYRITIQWWVLALAGFAAILIAFVTISFQSVKAALENPVKSLRSE
jgi:putative ABC transport system permease protein